MPKLRMSILNVTPDISALKFRSWIKEQAVDIQINADDTDFIVIRLFMPLKLIRAFGRSKLNKLLGEIAHAFPNVYRIDLREVEHSLTVPQMQEESVRGQEDLSSIIEEIGGSLFSGDCEDGPRNPPLLH